MDWQIPVHVLTVRLGTASSNQSAAIHALMHAKGYVAWPHYKSLGAYYKRAAARAMCVHGALAASAKQQRRNCSARCPNLSSDAHRPL